MAIPNDIAQRAVRQLTRGFICLLGVGAIFWGLFLLPIFWRQASPQSIAQKLLDTDSFKFQSLLHEAQRAEEAAEHPFCVPTALRSLFVLRLFILNRAIAESNQIIVASSYTPLRDAVRKALSCAPADPFAWLTLFWLDAAKYDVNERNVTYLRLSNELGRNEAWVALWRVQLVFLRFEQLPDDLARDAVDQFMGLLNTGQLYRQTAKVFKDASPVVQNRILERLRTTSVLSRQKFARTLNELGANVDIPGVEDRKWRRGDGCPITIDKKCSLSQ